jgi:hypothetical protein
MNHLKNETQWIDINRFEDCPRFDLRHQQGGFLPSEGHALVQICRQHGIRTLVESGRWRGFSTEMFATVPGEPLNIVSVDLRYEPFYREVEERLRPFPNVHLHYGNSLALVPHIVATSAVPTALFVDGPKGQLAVELIRTCFRLSPNLKLAFLHDSYRGSVARTAVEKEFPDAWFTDDKAYCQRFHHLDNVSSETYRQLSQQEDFDGKYHLSIDTMNEETSYGPTLACISRPTDLRSQKPAGISSATLWLNRCYAEAYAKARLLVKGT